MPPRGDGLPQPDEQPHRKTQAQRPHALLLPKAVCYPISLGPPGTVREKRGGERQITVPGYNDGVLVDHSLRGFPPPATSLQFHALQTR
jgi:hypothetical protein